MKRKNEVQDSKNDLQTKKIILAKALELASTNPNWKISVSDLKRETGYSTGSFYHFFPKGSDDIASDLYVEILADLKNFIFDDTDSLRSIEKFMKKCVSNFFDWHLSHRDESLFLNHFSETAQAYQPEEAIKIRMAFSKKMQERLTEMSKVEFPKKKNNFQILLPAFYGSCQEIVRVWSLQGRPDHFLEDSKNAMAKFLFHGFIGG